jgi:flavin reductase (DIM6/NTAB) family NADH-FMN oxidoreductase RutF
VAENRPIGPFPEGRDPEVYDRQRRRILWAMPAGLYVLGTTAAGRRNLMTLNWATQVAAEPKLLAVSVETAALTHRLLREGGVFSLNILARQDRAVVRKFVKPLDDEGEPGVLAGFAVTRASTGAPILDLAVAWLDCRVRQVVPFVSHSLFLGEIVDCGGPEPGAGFEGLEVLRMEDTRMSYGG